MNILKNKLHSYIQGITQLVYPLQCWGCGSDLVTKDEMLCVQCTIQLPETDFADKADNYVEKIFYGRLPIEAATSLYFFSKDSLLQHLLHQLKYKGNQSVGVHFGNTIGRRLIESNRFHSIDYLTPIPLSNKRKKQRGYNQALAICNGIAETMQIPILDNLTIRQKDNETQTHKTRQERWENMQDVFKIEDSSLIENKNILLVDDVITTGATLEACGEVLLKASNTKLYVASVALATN